ncbi:MAG: transposase, partial [Bacteroidota bacterium]
PYMRKMNPKRGAPAVNPRIVIGSLFIKHKLKLSDKETIQMIQENPYIQYFLGQNVYDPNFLFDSSLFVTIRKRMGLQEFDDMNKVIMRETIDEKRKKSDCQKIRIREN